MLIESLKPFYHNSRCHLVDSKRPRNWKPDDKIQEKFQKKLEEDERFKSRVEYLRKRQKDLKTTKDVIVNALGSSGVKCTQ
jgi:hypothetical protein